MKGKHIVAEIEGVRCSVVESGLTEERMVFLSEILNRNRYAVKKESEKSKEGTPLGSYVLGVTDLLFNPVIAVYQQRLKHQDGKPITPAFWNQWPVDTEIPYWQVKF